MVSQEKQCLCCKWQAYLTTTGSISILPPQSLNSSEPLLCTCISAADWLQCSPVQLLIGRFGDRGRNVTKFPHRFLFLFISWFLWLQFQCQTKWLSVSQFYIRRQSKLVSVIMRQVQTCQLQFEASQLVSFLLLVPLCKVARCEWK